ncbi:MAG: pyruvate kinase [Deltaproteobacteria bacterium CG11_big_fil_rev_8_21_14_0_20_45_16]|nr:MAG: pyruvate kinase [Deltaproteobacteria bacterium CG11_big_fil_rev_8_21_14_0_20_45_16]
MKSEIDFFKLIDRSNPLTGESIRLKRAKIVCTMGPSCQDPKILRQMIREGMDVARLNFSHGTHADHLRSIQSLRRIAKEEGKYLGILQDIQGPKIRIGKFPKGIVELRKNDEFIVRTDQVVGSSRQISISLKNLHQHIEVGHRILLDDGLIFLVVEKIRGRAIHTRVVFGGSLKDNKGVNLPDTRLKGFSCLTPKDKKDIAFGLKNGVDFIALSFISEAQDIMKVRRLIKSQPDIPLIAKIETRQAVHNIEEIINVADGIMVARGDLGVECPLEKVPGLQKRMIRAANRKGKFVITATQMLESMTRSPRPTRAEASDVANAVLDGTDAVMLSAETASGQFPLESVKTMTRIIMRTEQYQQSFSDIQETRLHESVTDIGHGVTAAAVHITSNLQASAIVAFTHSGATARYVSRLRPSPIIFALSPFEAICRRMAVVWGVIPGIIRKMKHTDEMPALSRPVLTEFKMWRKGTRFVMLSGTPVAKPGTTNLVKVHEVK